MYKQNLKGVADEEFDQKNLNRGCDSNTELLQPMFSLRTTELVKIMAGTNTLNEIFSLL